MNTSAKPAPEQVAAGLNGPPAFEPFPYARIPAGNRRGSMSDVAATVSPDEDVTEQALVQARQNGFLTAQKAFEEQITKERAKVAEALEDFRRERSTYFEKIEGEIVQLALSIAGKVLHREAQIDPLLLAGIVRVTLEKMDGATSVILRLNPQIAEDWRSYLSRRLQPDAMPEILEDPAQPADRCVLETSMGTAVLGFEPQLKEIEQGLLDLVAARPGAS